MSIENFENAGKVLVPKGRDMELVLNWIEEQGFTPPQPPTEARRCLH